MSMGCYQGAVILRFTSPTHHTPANPIPTVPSTLTTQTRLIEFAKQRQKRFISCLPVDEGFNKIKAAVDLQRNTRISPENAMATMVETGLLSELNKFEEVDPDSIRRNRLSASQLPPDAFKARRAFLLHTIGFFLSDATSPALPP